MWRGNKERERRTGSRVNEENPGERACYHGATRKLPTWTKVYREKRKERFFPFSFVHASERRMPLEQLKQLVNSAFQGQQPWQVSRNTALFLIFLFFGARAWRVIRKKGLVNAVIGFLFKVVSTMPGTASLVSSKVRPRPTSATSKTWARALSFFRCETVVHIIAFCCVRVIIPRWCLQVDRVRVQEAAGRADQRGGAPRGQQPLAARRRHRPGRAPRENGQVGKRR